MKTKSQITTDEIKKNNISPVPLQKNTHLKYGISTSKRDILLVEDDPDDIELALHAFKANKVTQKIIVAKDGKEALDYLLGDGKYEGRNLLEPPAFILLDLGLGRMSGLEVLQNIRKNEITSLYPVIIMSGSTSRNEIIAAYYLGANSYICKPVDSKQYIDAVSLLCQYWLKINEPPLRQVK
jgi:two-component system, response regulator